VQKEGAAYGSLAQQSRGKDLKTASGILWFVGILTLLVNGYMFVNAQKEYDKLLNTELGRQGSSLSDIRRRPAEEIAEFEAAYDQGLRLTRVIAGVTAFLGLVFIGCALMVKRKPVAATVTGLVLYVGALAAQLAFEPSSLPKGLIVKVFIIVGLVSAMRAALAFERNERIAAVP